MLLLVTSCKPRSGTQSCAAISTEGGDHRVGYSFRPSPASQYPNSHLPDFTYSSEVPGRSQDPFRPGACDPLLSEQDPEQTQRPVLEPYTVPIQSDLDSVEANDYWAQPHLPYEQELASPFQRDAETREDQFIPEHTRTIDQLQPHPQFYCPYCDHIFKRKCDLDIKKITVGRSSVHERDVISVSTVLQTRKTYEDISRHTGAETEFPALILPVQKLSPGLIILNATVNRSTSKIGLKISYWDVRYESQQDILNGANSSKSHVKKSFPNDLTE
ncbi:hypothetical protein N431DRAFT_490261 [Stipitochalara longipes BDJ]|nr:hypothetical protein N431DRAFT_490261 [Stipitochalara longipes BDJ]